jgi:hypothetical protein
MSVSSMSVPTVVLDCPTCGSAGAVYHWTCEICQLDVPQPPVLHPSIPLRFADVIVELRAIADLAAETPALDGESVAAACRRAESLLFVLRKQFLEDVVDGEPVRRELAPTFTSRSPLRPERFTSAG